MGKSRKTRKNSDPAAFFIRYSDINGLKWTRNKMRRPQSKTDPVGYFHVYKFKCSCKDAEWESADIEAPNGEFCDNPKCAQKPMIKPYSGPILSPTPCFSTPGKFNGRFQCPNTKCNHHWRSHRVFANKYQACRECGFRAYSYFMTECETGSDAKGQTQVTPHDKASCEMCLINPKACKSGKRGSGGGNRFYIKTPKFYHGLDGPAELVPGPDGFIEVVSRKQRRRRMRSGGSGSTGTEDSIGVEGQKPEQDQEDQVNGEDEETEDSQGSDIEGIIRDLQSEFLFESLGTDEEDESKSSEASSSDSSNYENDAYACGCLEPEPV